MNTWQKRGQTGTECQWQNSKNRGEHGLSYYNYRSNKSAPYLLIGGYIMQHLNNKVTLIATERY